jgi:hypothetical protein
MWCNYHTLVAFHHLMLEIPASALAYLCDNSVAISQKIDVEIDVVNGLV